MSFCVACREGFASIVGKEPVFSALTEGSIPAKIIGSREYEVLTAGLCRGAGEVVDAALSLRV